jgi:hypothetical protein
VVRSPANYSRHDLQAVRVYRETGTPSIAQRRSDPSAGAAYAYLGNAGLFCFANRRYAGDALPEVELKSRQHFGSTLEKLPLRPLRICGFYIQLVMLGIHTNSSA